MSIDRVCPESSMRDAMQKQLVATLRQMTQTTEGQLSGGPDRLFAAQLPAVRDPLARSRGPENSKMGVQDPPENCDRQRVQAAWWICS